MKWPLFPAVPGVKRVVAAQEATALPHPGNTVLSAMKTLTEAGAANFDPVRYRYLEALIEQMGQTRHAVAVVLEQKALAALAVLEEDFTSARLGAETDVARIASKYPEEVELAQTLLSQGELDQLGLLVLRLRNEKTQVEVSDLKDRLHNPDKLSQRSSNALENLMRSEVSRLVDATGPTANKPGEPEGSRGDELRSIQPYRESLARINADKVVARAIAACPVDAGPLNPQKLIIRSLSSMRDLSPHYLNRFVTYMETLLWLEQAGLEKPPEQA